MKAFALAAILALGLIGCGPKDAPELGSDASAPQTQDQIEFQRLREGLFAMNAVVEGLIEARAKTEELMDNAKGDVKEGLADVRDAIDTVGEALEPFNAAPANREDFDKEFAKWDENRLKAIEAGSEAVIPLEEARETVRAMRDDKLLAENGLLDLLVVANEDLREAVTTLGGKIADPEVEP